MTRWSLLSEYFALILIVVIMLFFYDSKQVHSARRRLFWSCLLLSVASILLNIASVHTIENIGRVSVEVNMALNSAYFLVSVLMSTAITYYIFQRLLEFVYDKRCLQRARLALWLVLVVYTGLILWNLYSGVIFYFDQAGNYCRGPLNAAGFLAPVLEVGLVLICYFRNRKSVSRAMVRIMWTVPPIVVLLVLYQVAYPEQLLNGTTSALANLIIFISFQSSRIERDPLTGINNRRSFMEELTLRMAGRQNYQVILVALKQFARVNQVYGHSSGDALLFQIAGALRKLSAGGRVFRYNSVEFLLLIPGSDEKEREERLERVLSCMRREWPLGEDRVSVPFCAAELTYDGQDCTPEQIISYLEYCIRLGKEDGRELVRFDGETAQRHRRREYLIQTMQVAVRDGRFQVWYQPVYHRDTGSFDSAEALIRLSDEQGQPISPAEFIPVAEENGLIDALSWIVLEGVCRLLGSGTVPELKTVSINLSMQQFLRKDLTERIEDMLRKYSVAPERLKLEITERVLADNSQLARQTMEKMSRRHLEFLLDDFGTGYSNFSSVLGLPFEAVKLDRSLMAGLTNDPRSRLMADTIIPFFHKLGQQVVAEGIESREQAELALRCGADRIQGFYYARPMPESELAEWYRSRKKAAEHT